MSVERVVLRMERGATGGPALFRLVFLACDLRIASPLSQLEDRCPLQINLTLLCFESERGSTEDSFLDWVGGEGAVRVFPNLDGERLLFWWTKRLGRRSETLRRAEMR